MHPQGMHTLLALMRIRSHSYTVHMWILDPWGIRVEVRGSDGGCRRLRRASSGSAGQSRYQSPIEGACCDRIVQHNGQERESA